jgi:hypothetical protein
MKSLAIVIATFGSGALGRMSGLHDNVHDLGDLFPASSKPAASDKPGAKSTCTTTPVAKKQVVFPDSLAGRTTQNYDMYSGYVNVTTEDW